MSQDAEDYVETLPFKGGALELLRVIARQIPAGQTTTPLIRIGDLAAPAHQHRRTVTRWLGVLEDIDVIKVHDGGRGKVARYELLNLAGDRPLTTAPLPLLGSAAPRRPRPRSRSDTLDLFDHPSRYERTAINVGRFVSRCRSYVGHHVGQIALRYRSYVGRFVTRLRNIGQSALRWATGLGEDSTRARATYNNSRTTTTAPSADAPPTVRAKPPPCRWGGTTHAWCDGRVHVPMHFHLEERRKLARQPGETDADLDAQLFERYAAELAAIPEAQAIPDKNEFEFWKRVLRSGSATATTRGPTRATRSPIPDNDLFGRAADERRRRYGGGS